MSKIVTYKHHDVNVLVREDLKGKHRDYCLCFQNCEYFKPWDPENNCRIAAMVYALDRLCGITTPVWECPEYLKEPK